MHANIMLWYSTFKISDRITPLHCPHMVKVDRYSTTLRGCCCGSRICQTGGYQPKGMGRNPLLAKSEKDLDQGGLILASPPTTMSSFRAVSFMDHIFRAISSEWASSSAKPVIDPWPWSTFKMFLCTAERISQTHWNLCIVSLNLLYWETKNWL